MVKKQYVDLIKLLETNKAKKVSSLLEMPEFKAIVESSTSRGREMFRKDDSGKVIAHWCNYHKCYHNDVEQNFGAKASSKSGFAPTCKVGTSHWNAQYKAFKEGEINLLTGVAKGDIDPKDILSLKADLEAKRNEILMENSPECFDTIDEAIK